MPSATGVLEIEAFLSRHASAAATDIAAIREGISSGACQLSSEPLAVRGPDILKTYRIRSQNLARFDSEHARLLRRETEHLCNSLESKAIERCRFWSFDFTDGTSILLIDDADRGDLLGTLHTVSKLRVSPEAWAALWGH